MGVLVAEQKAMPQAQLAQAALLQLQDALEKEVCPSFRWLAELDVVISLAEVSAQNDFTRPVLTERNIINIDKGVVHLYPSPQPAIWTYFLRQHA
jgi:DNA mismatch repair ATPase MutS